MHTWVLPHWTEDQRLIATKDIHCHFAETLSLAKAEGLIVSMVNCCSKTTQSEGREGCSSFLRFVNVCCRQARLDMQVATEPLTGTTLQLRSNATTWAASESTVTVLQSCSFHLCHACRVCRLNFIDSEA